MARRRTAREHAARAAEARAREDAAARRAGTPPPHESRAAAAAEYAAAQNVQRLRAQLQHVEHLTPPELLAFGSVLLCAEPPISPSDQIRLIKLLLDEAARSKAPEGAADLASPDDLAAAVRHLFGVR